MPKKIDDEIIELTDVVEDEPQAEEADDFQSDVIDHDFFQQTPPPPTDKQKEVLDDDLERFFSQDQPSGTEPPKEPGVGQKSGEEGLGAFPGQADFDEDLQSVLKDLVQEIQEDQQNSRGGEKEETGEALDLEKQWKAALGSEEAGNRAGVTSEPQFTAATDPGKREESAPPMEVIPAFAPPTPWDQAISVEINRQIAQALSGERVETALERAFRQVLEPLAERILSQVAEKILIQEIERIKADLRSVEEEV
jgi:hypothetical protein